MAFFDFLDDDPDDPKLKAPAPVKGQLPKVGEKLKIGGTEATVVEDAPGGDTGTIMSADLSKPIPMEEVGKVNLQMQIEQGRKKIGDMMSRWDPQQQTPQSDALGKSIEGAIKVQTQLENYAQKAKSNDLKPAEPPKVAGQPEAQQGAAPDQGDSFVSKGGVKDLWNDFGIPPEAMDDKLAKGMQALSKVIPGVTFMSPVSNFYAGLATVTRALGPQAVQGVFGRLMKEMQKPEQGYEKEAKRQEGLAAQAESTYESDYKSLKNAAREIARSDGLNNFGSIMLFVLTSMVIGPKLAILFFADKAKRGELQAERDEIAMRMETNRRKAASHREMAGQARMKAIGVDVEEKQTMKRDLMESWNRFNIEKMRIKGRAEQADLSREQRSVLETAKKLEFSIGKDLRSATDLERDATEIERNLGDKNIVNTKRQQAAQLRNRAEINMDRHHQFLTTHGLVAEDEPGRAEEEAD